MSEKIKSGNYTPDDILDWYDTHTSPSRVEIIKKQPKENFDDIVEYEEDGTIYEIGTDDGVSVILNQKKNPKIFGVDIPTATIGGIKVKQQLGTAGEFISDAINPVNIAKGVNTGVVNVFGLVDSVTGGSVTKLDNYFKENFPNTLGKSFEYKQPEGAGEVTGQVIGQYVLTDLFLRRAIPFFNKNLATGLAADATTVGLVSSKDEGNLASLLGMFLPESEDPNAIAKAITFLQPDADDSEIEGRLKNVVSDTGALGAILSLFKIAKGLISNPKLADDLQEAQSAGAAATPKEAPTPVEVVDSSGQPIKQADQVVQSEKPFYSNVENTISNFTFKKQPGNQILATLNNTAGIKQSEIQDLGLDTFLKDNPSVTKEQLDDFIADKSLTTRVKDEILEGTRDPSGDVGDINFAVGFEDTRPDILTNANSLEDAKLIVNNDEGLYSQMLEYGKARGLSDDDIMTEEFLEDFLKEQFGITQTKPQTKPTKFGDYVTPGGENYKEMLITVPGTPKVFTKHHFTGEVAQGENLIAHARFNDRTIDGKKILFIEEIQSDLHQAGRKQGYSSLNLDVELENINSQLSLLSKTMDELKIGDDTAKIQDYMDQYNKLLEKRQRFVDETRGTVADAPFKKNWYELTMKRIIKYAVDNGYDGIAFTSGDMQVARYSGMSNPEGLKGFYDNTLTTFTNKFGKKYGAKIDEASIGKQDEGSISFVDGKFNYQNTRLREAETIEDVYQITKENKYLQNEFKLYLRDDLNEATYANMSFDELQKELGSDIDSYINEWLINDFGLVIGVDSSNKVPIMLFTPKMEKEILTEGVSIAQVEERDKSTAVV